MLDDRQQSMSRVDDYSRLDKIGRYLIHGFAFSVMMSVVVIVFTITLPMFIILASILGLIIWFGLIFLAWGWVNGLLCGRLWDIGVSEQLTSLMGHGFVLFLVLLIVNLPISAILQFVLLDISPRALLLAQIASFSFFDGVIGKAIGGMFKEGYGPTAGPAIVSRRTPIGRRERCPFCGAEPPYRDQDVNSEGVALCRMCGAILQDPRYPIGGLRKPQSTPQDESNRPPPRND